MSDFALNEIARRLANIIRVGTVQSVNASGYRARVQIGPLLTAPLPWLTTRAGEDRTWWAPSVGEQVLVLSPDGELAAGWILPGAYTDAKPAPATNPAIHRTTYRDGAVVEYDTAAHRLTVSGLAQVVVNASASVTVTAPAVTINGTTTINGDTTINGFLTQGTGTSGAGAIMAGPVNVASDVIAGGVSLRNHTHGGVDPGGGNTGVPN
jgi:phage baseplate assembly protein V